MTLYSVWHHRDNDGYVVGVFASQSDNWYEAMMKYAEQLKSEAIKGIEAEIDDSQEDSISVEFTDTKNDYTEYDTLQIGVPAQPFSTVHVTDQQGETVGTIDVGKEWETWSKVPETFESSEQEEDK